jgi:hypothetical protein
MPLYAMTGGRLDWGSGVLHEVIVGHARSEQAPISTIGARGEAMRYVCPMWESRRTS